MSTFVKVFHSFYSGIYYSQPIALENAANVGIALGAVPREPISDEVYKTESVSEPKVRKDFPESWIFDDFPEYVSKSFQFLTFLDGNFLNVKA